MKYPYTVIASVQYHRSVEMVVCRFFASDDLEALAMTDVVFNNYDAMVIVLGHNTVVDETTLVKDQDYFYDKCNTERIRYADVIAKGTLVPGVIGPMIHAIHKLDKYLKDMKDYMPTPAR